MQVMQEPLASLTEDKSTGNLIRQIRAMLHNPELPKEQNRAIRDFIRTTRAERLRNSGLGSHCQDGILPEITTTEEYADINFYCVWDDETFEQVLLLPAASECQCFPGKTFVRREKGKSPVSPEEETELLRFRQGRTLGDKALSAAQAAAVAIRTIPKARLQSPADPSTRNKNISIESSGKRGRSETQNSSRRSIRDTSGCARAPHRSGTAPPSELDLPTADRAFR